MRSLLRERLLFVSAVEVAVKLLASLFGQNARGYIALADSKKCHVSDFAREVAREGPPNRLGYRLRSMKDDLAREKERLAPMLALSKLALNDLASGDGTLWKESHGELHSQYNEIPIWVLLYEDGDLLRTHAALHEILQPHMDALAPIEMVLLYVAIEGKVFGAKLSGNEAIISAGTDGKMDLNWYPRSSGLPTFFRSRDSKRLA